MVPWLLKIIRKGDPLLKVEKNPKFEYFRGKSVFYIVKPPSCIDGAKLGKSANAQARFKGYYAMWGENMTIEYVMVFKKRDMNYFSGKAPQVLFERYVIRELKNLGIPPIRGYEFFENKTKIMKAVKNVSESFKYKPSLRRFSDRIRSMAAYRPPKIGDIILINYKDKLSPRGLRAWKAEILNKSEKKNHYWIYIYDPTQPLALQRKDETGRSIGVWHIELELGPDNFDLKLYREGDWKFFEQVRPPLVDDEAISAFAQLGRSGDMRPYDVLPIQETDEADDVVEIVEQQFQPRRPFTRSQQKKKRSIRALDAAIGADKIIQAAARRSSRRRRRKPDRYRQ